MQTQVDQAQLRELDGNNSLPQAARRGMEDADRNPIGPLILGRSSADLAPG
jgi:hypothetical protein